MEVEHERLRSPKIEVLGVYRLPISLKLIRAQTGHFSDEWVAAIPEDAMRAAREELEETVLVEAQTHGRDKRFHVNDFTQELEVPDDQWQAAWMEVCLSDDGTALQTKPFDPWPPSGDLRVAFYMHLWDAERPLETSYGPVACPHADFDAGPSVTPHPIPARRLRYGWQVTMAGNLVTVDVRTRADWRRWLAKHHASSPGIWLLRHKQHTGVKSMPYGELVCEALCFGWVDSLIKRVDDDRFAIKVTPRKPTSKWSDINRKRWKHLKATGLLAAPGLAAAPTGNSYAPHPPIPELPTYVAKAFKTNPKAWQQFQALAPTYRRDFVVWIHTAKRAETRERRIRESIALLSAGKKLGLK